MVTAEKPRVLFGGDVSDREPVRKSLQLNVFGFDARQRVEKRLQSWYQLAKDVSRLEDQLKRDYEDMRKLNDLPAITPNYQDADMPRGTNISDPTGNHVARSIDLRILIESRINAKETELTLKRMQLREIEDAVSELNKRDASLIRLFYLNGYKYHQVAVHVDVRVSESRFYQVRDSVLDALASQL